MSAFVAHSSGQKFMDSEDFDWDSVMNIGKKSFLVFCDNFRIPLDLHQIVRTIRYSSAFLNAADEGLFHRKWAVLSALNFPLKLINFVQIV